MNVDDAQKATVAGWIKEGLSLAQIQKRMEKELGLTLTYMELRFLVDDLKVMPKDAERPAAPAPVVSSPLTDPKASPATPPAAGGLSLQIDSVTRAGAMVSGTVRFSDGNSASWYIDQTGRLGVVPDVQGYKPSAADVQAFQAELQNELQRHGF